MPDENVDVCIIGSGWGGSIPALRLSEKLGPSVVVLERGKEWPCDRFQQSQDLGYLSSIFEFFISTNTNLFVTVAKSILGGTSPLFSNVMLRTPSFVFNRLDEQGRRVWPSGLSRVLFDPYYDRVKEDVGIVQLRWHDERYPGEACSDAAGEPCSRDQAGIWDLVSKRGFAFALACQAAGYNQVSPVPVALDRCVNCGWCTAGCMFGAKRTPEFVYIPRAREAGARFLTEHQARSIEPILFSDRYRVHAFDSVARRQKTFAAKVVIVAAGTMATPVLLLRSKSRHPLRWTRLSRQVGRRLSINGDNAFFANMPSRASEFFRGKIINISCWNFLNPDDPQSPQFIFQDGFSPPVGLTYLADVRQAGGKTWGLAYKRLMENFGTTMMGVLAMGIDGDDGTVNYNPLLDAPTVSWRLSDKTRRLFASMEGKLREIVEHPENGGELLRTRWTEEGRIGSVHPLGTCRMGSSPDQGVVDGNGEVFNYPNLFITDGSAIPGALAVNPSLTIAANAERISDHILTRIP